MIYFTKPVQTEDLYVVKKEEFSITCNMCDTYTAERPRIFITGNLINLLIRDGVTEQPGPQGFS
jgi:hypothetical protein